MTETLELTTAQVERIKRDFAKLEDGYHAYWPGGARGALSADDLRAIAKLLDEVNATWDAQVPNEPT